MRPAPSTPSRRLFRSALLGLASFLVTGCEGFKQSPPDAPDALRCTEIVAGGDDGSSLEEALSTAAPGACVVVVSKTYKGSFVVPRGVTLASAKNQRAILTGATADKPAISLVGGDGSALCGLSVLESLGLGVAVRGGLVVIKDVTIEKSAKTGLAASCDNCGAAEKHVYTDVRVRGSAVGVQLRGAMVEWTGGEVTESNSPSLSGGAGLVVQEGARLTLSKVAIERNQAVGLLVDGKGTTAALDGVIVRANGERGIWAQRLEGARTLSIGGTSLIENNALVGVGVYRSAGVSIENSEIRGTQLRPTLIDLKTAQVGDGLLVAQASVSVSKTKLIGNARAQALVDTPSGAVAFAETTVQAPEGGYKVVVQNDANNGRNVTVDEADVSKVAQALVVLPAVDVARVAP